MHYAELMYMDIVCVNEIHRVNVFREISVLSAEI